MTIPTFFVSSFIYYMIGLALLIGNIPLAGTFITGRTSMARMVAGLLGAVKFILLPILCVILFAGIPFPSLVRFAFLAAFIVSAGLEIFFDHRADPELKSKPVYKLVFGFDVVLMFLMTLFSLFLLAMSAF